MGGNQKNEIMNTRCPDDLSLKGGWAHSYGGMKILVTWEGLRRELPVLCIEKSREKWYGHLVRMCDGHNPSERGSRADLELTEDIQRCLV